MDNNEQNSRERKLDELLDQTLADYSSAEPRSGLEDRILARLNEQRSNAESQPTWLRWWPALTFAAAAVIALVIFISVPRHPKEPQQAGQPTAEIPATHMPAPALQAANPRSTQVASAPRHARSAIRTVHEKPRAATVAQVAIVQQPVFPAPSPLSAQERLLFTYVRKTDRAEIAANAKPNVLSEIERRINEQRMNEQQINQVLPAQKSSDSNSNMR